MADYPQDEILIIGNGVRTLAYEELLLTIEQKAKIDGSTQFAFLSHGTWRIIGSSPATYYSVQSQDLETFIDARDIITKILSNTKNLNLETGPLCHIISCYAATTVNTMQNYPIDGIMNEIPPKSTILFYGGNIVTRGLNVFNALSIIRTASLTKNVASIADRFEIIKESMLELSMIGAIQHLGNLDEIDDISTNLHSITGKEDIFPLALERPNILHINYSAEIRSLHNPQTFITNAWINISTILKHKLGIELEQNFPILPHSFEYIRNAIGHGGLIADLNFLSISSDPTVKNALLAKAQALVDGFFQLVTDNIISKAQYDNLIGQTFLLLSHDAKDEQSQDIINCLKDYYKILMSRGLDFMVIVRSNPVIFNIHPRSIKMLMDMDLMDIDFLNLPLLLLKNTDDEPLLTHILSDSAYAAKILEESHISCIDINSDKETNNSVLKTLSTYTNEEHLSAVLKHFADIQISPYSAYRLCKICPKQILQLILSKCEHLSINLLASVPALIQEEDHDNRDLDCEEEYNNIGTHIDLKVGVMTQLEKELESLALYTQDMYEQTQVENLLGGIDIIVTILYKTIIECARISNQTCLIDTSTITQSIQDAMLKSTQPLSDALQIIEQSLDPLFAELGAYQHVIRKTATDNIIAQNSKPLILALAELDNASEILPIILKFSEDINISPELFLQLVQTPHAAQIIPMILDKASAWQMELCLEVFDQIKGDKELLQAIVPNKHISMDDLLHDLTHQTEVQHVIDEYHLLG